MSENNSQVSRLVAFWIIVGVPLLFGIVQTLVRAARLFTG